MIARLIARPPTPILSAGINIMSYMSGLQNGSSQLQAIPILGPLVGSPLKAVISIAQLITALALKCFSAMCLFNNNNQYFTTRYQEMSFKANEQIKEGSYHLLYSAVNILSLGVTSYYTESASAKNTPPVHNNTINGYDSDSDSEGCPLLYQTNSKTLYKFINKNKEKPWNP